MRDGWLRGWKLDHCEGPDMTVGDIDHLIQLLARLPGLGPRSARRAALKMINKP